MELIIKNRKIKINKMEGLLSKFRGLKFVLNPIDEGYRFKSRYANTYLLCQKVDIIMTDKDNKILYIYEKVKTEKIIFPKPKVFYTYFLPLNTGHYFKKGDTLKLK